MKLLCLSSPVSVGLDHTTGLKLLVLQCVAKESAEALSRVDGNRHLPHPKKASCWIVETADGCNMLPQCKLFLLESVTAVHSMV